MLVPRHNPIHTVFQSKLLRVIDHRCDGRDNARDEVPQNYEIVLPRSGAYQRRDAHGAFLADPNQVLFFNQGEPYDISHPIRGGDASTIFVVAPSVLFEMMRAHNPNLEDDRRIFPRSHLTLDSRLQVLQYRLLRKVESGEALEIEEEIISLVDEILHAAQWTNPAKRSSSPNTLLVHAEQIRTVKTFINANISLNLQLEDISSAVHLSPYHLCRVFKREVGMTIHQYIKRLRLFNAAEWMAENPVTRLDILALDCGFSNHGHFSTAFRQAFGINPSDFRDGRFRELSKNLKT